MRQSIVGDPQATPTRPLTAAAADGKACPVPDPSPEPLDAGRNDDSPRAERQTFLRPRLGAERVTSIELFYDLVSAFALTQLTEHLRQSATLAGGLQALILLGLVWVPWVYTTWLTNWLDPERLPVRGVLLALALASLVLSAAIPAAYTTRGLAVGGAYALMQVGRSAFAVGALHDEPMLQRNFERILVWCCLSGGCAIAGGLVAGDARDALWAGAVTVDLMGGAAGFFVPGLGRSSTQEWTIDGAHFAERCSAFVLIALGETIVVIGTAISVLNTVTVREIVAFVVAASGAGAFWWIYFDRSAEAGAQQIARSTDPGRLGRSAYGLTHPIMVAGIIVSASGSERVLTHPLSATSAATSWLLLGGTALFVAGHATFKRLLWRVWPWSRIAALVVLGGLALAAPHLEAVVTSALAVLVVVLVAVSDRSIPRAETATTPSS